PPNLLRASRTSLASLEVCTNRTLLWSGAHGEGTCTTARAGWRPTPGAPPRPDRRVDDAGRKGPGVGDTVVLRCGRHPRGRRDTYRRPPVQRAGAVSGAGPGCRCPDPPPD